MLPRATENAVAGDIWPSGRYLLTTKSDNSQVIPTATANLPTIIPD